MQDNPSGDAALLIGRTGRWRWPWAVIGPAMIIGLIITFYSSVLVPIERWIGALYVTPLPEDVHLAPGRLDTYFGFVSFSIALVLPTMIVLTAVHGESWRAGLGPLRRFDWSLFGKAALAYMIVTLLGTAIDFLRWPGSMRLVEHGTGYLLWFLLGALVILPQAFAEDYLFKGYLLRVWGAVLPYRIVAVPLCAVAFTALHAGNSDVGSDIAFNIAGFLLIELVAFALVLRTGSVATATGLHWINNVYAMGIVATLPGQSSSLALIEYAHPLLMAGRSKSSDPVEIVSLIAGAALLWVLLTWTRSPLCLPRAEYPVPQQPEVTAEPPHPGPPSPEATRTGEGSSAATSN